MLPDAEGRSPLEALSVTRYQGKTYQQERSVSVGTNRVTVLENNPNRLAWEMINNSLVDVRIATTPTVTATNGWLVAQAGGVISMSWYEDGESVGYEIYAIAPAAGGILWIREVLRS